MNYFYFTFLTLIIRENENVWRLRRTGLRSIQEDSRITPPYLKTGGNSIDNQVTLMYSRMWLTETKLMMFFSKVAVILGYTNFLNTFDNVHRRDWPIWWCYCRSILTWFRNRHYYAFLPCVWEIRKSGNGIKQIYDL